MTDDWYFLEDDGTLFLCIDFEDSGNHGFVEVSTGEFASGGWSWVLDSAPYGFGGHRITDGNAKTLEGAMRAIRRADARHGRQPVQPWFVRQTGAEPPAVEPPAPVSTTPAAVNRNWSATLTLSGERAKN